MSEDEIESRLDSVRINLEGEQLTLEECLKPPPLQKMEKLYDFYNVFNEVRKTKLAKLNYLRREIPSQFFDNLMNMSTVEDRKILARLYNGEDIEHSVNLASMALLGYIFVNKEGKVILPLELGYFISNFMISNG